MMEPKSKPLSPVESHPHLDDPKILVDIFWKEYQENCAQGRHHETQRSAVASAIVAVSAGVIGVVSFDKTLSRTDLPLTVLLIELGIFGAAFSYKHYERFRLHMKRAKFFRNAIDSYFRNAPIASIKKAADDAHAQQFTQIRSMRLHVWWAGLNFLVALTGIVLSVIACLHR